MLDFSDSLRMWPLRAEVATGSSSVHYVTDNDVYAVDVDLVQQGEVILQFTRLSSKLTGRNFYT